MASQRMGARQRLRAFDESLQTRLRRVRGRLWSILQVALGAGIAYWLAMSVLGHVQPFFAPITVVIVLGLSGGERINKAMEMALGCVVGVLVGDLMFLGAGSGGWQIAVAVAVALVVASFLSKSTLVSNQVAIGSILIVTIMPPGGESTGVDRTLDAIVGSAVAMIIIALLPTSPLAAGRREASKVLSMVSSVLDDVADGLRGGEERLVEEALIAARGSQKQINSMAAAARSGAESTRISPLLWSRRRNVRHLERVVAPADNAIRNARVLARRALVLVQDQDYASVTEQQLALLDELSEIALTLSDVYAGRDQLDEAIEIPDLVNQLRSLGARSGIEAAGEDPVLSSYAVLAQTRSIITDLLEVCGMSRESAVAVLAPTSETPAFPPEVRED
nr:FUSC family protein [Corynebacterium guangdongense]